ncbi:MAG: type II toxin-antitoxin system HicB family antitoxin [Alphaproteobacteria bacterium]|nr:type II toxin-antitoxin system HicB family antitoxin [Alphaproteobacteria bacterium]MCW5742555.1 type II toxin-antitoxin system HicB family antitoxin [Alphaproteobacteria bacterium]
MARGYYGLIKRDAATKQYEVEFPDLPGCVTVADSFVEAGESAVDALAGWIEAALDTGQEIPPPTDIQPAFKRARGASLVWVPAPPIKTKAVPVTISLREHLLEKIDRAAADEGMTRSSFITFHALQAAGQKAWARKVKSTGRRRSAA